VFSVCEGFCLIVVIGSQRTNDPTLFVRQLWFDNARLMIIDPSVILESSQTEFQDDVAIIITLQSFYLFFGVSHLTLWVPTGHRHHP
jgi:hypothetical protein